MPSCNACNNNYIVHDLALVFVSMYLYVCICVFVYLYLSICVCVIEFVYLYQHSASICVYIYVGYTWGTGTRQSNSTHFVIFWSAACLPPKKNRQLAKNQQKTDSWPKISKKQAVGQKPGKSFDFLSFFSCFHFLTIIPLLGFINTTRSSLKQTHILIWMYHIKYISKYKYIFNYDIYIYLWNINISSI